MALALALARAAAQANVAVRCESLAFYATKVSKKATDAAAASTELTTTKKEWDAVKVPEATASKVPTAVGGAAFPGDLRAVSGLGMGDGITSHTGKWLQGDSKPPIQWIAEAEPIKVHGLKVASHGTDDPALGCPIEYIDLRGTSREQPAVCKYTGNRYYSDDWKHGGGAH